MSEAALDTNKPFMQMVIGYFTDFKVLKETRQEFWAIQVVNFLDSTVWFSILTIATIWLSQDLGLSDVNAGYSVTGFTCAITIFLFFSGMFSDWLGIKRSLYLSMGSLLVLRIGLVIVGFVPTIPYRGWIATILLVLMAPFMATTQTVMQAAHKRFTTERSRAAGFSLWYLFMNVGAAASGFLVDIVRLWLKIPTTHIFTLSVFSTLVCLIVNFLFIKREEQLIGVEEGTKKDEVVKFTEKKVVKKSPFMNAAEVMKESAFWRLLVLIGLILGARAVFAYMYLLTPKYWLRVIGQDAAIGTLNAINPILIIVGIIILIPVLNKFNVFKMLVYGAIISSASLLILAIPWKLFSSNIATAHYMMAIVSLVVLSIGEIIWSPKLNEYTAKIAPAGQEGTYLGLTMVPWFLAKTYVSVASGHMLNRWCPEKIDGVSLAEKMIAGEVAFWDSPAAMWLILGLFAVAGCVIALFLKGWLAKGTEIGEKA